jgi:TolB protein
MNARRPLLYATLTALVVCGAAAAAAARAPGKNGEIVFRRYLDDGHQWGALYTVNPDGSGLRPLTHPPKGVLQTEPVWSADGTRIAFEEDRRGTSSRVYLADADGSGLKPLGACSGSCAGQDAPAWSPDGSKLALGAGSIRKEEVWIVNANGTGLEQLTQRNDTTTAGKDDGQPAWSPDGTRVAFVRHLAQPQPRGRTAIFVIGADGSGERQITPWKLDGGDHPDWSPDGTRLLFRSNSWNAPANALSNLYAIRPDGSRLTELTHARAGEQYLSASYSPDGKWITFGASRGTAKNAKPAIYVMRANGSGMRQITRSKFWDSAPDWGSRP